MISGRAVRLPAHPYFFIIRAAVLVVHVTTGDGIKLAQLHDLTFAACFGLPSPISSAIPTPLQRCFDELGICLRWGGAGAAKRQPVIMGWGVAAVSADWHVQRGVDKGRRNFGTASRRPEDAQ